MNRREKIIFTAVGSLMAVFSVGFLLSQFGGSYKPIEQSLLIGDPSASTQGSKESVLGLAGRVMERQQGGYLTILAVGDSTTGYEPRLVARFQVPERRQIMRRPDELTRERAQLLSRVAAQYEQVQPTKISPIFRAIQRGVQHLRAMGCGPQSRCQLLIQTDGDENVHEQIKLALKEMSEARSLPPPIDNTGIEILICGYAEIVPVINSTNPEASDAKYRDVDRVSRLIKIWSSLFAHPDLVEFAPYCPKVELHTED